MNGLVALVLGLSLYWTLLPRKLSLKEARAIVQDFLEGKYG